MGREAKVSDVLAELREEEGWSAFPYPDHLGFNTIGYGFLIDPRKGGGLPKPVAEFWLQYALNERVEAFRKLWPAFDNQPADVKNALKLMVYQLGPAGLFAFKRMLAALEARDRVTAAEEALDSEWSRQTPARARLVAAQLRG
jgi:lysozyme